LIARKCRLEAFNVTVMRQTAMNMPQGFNITGQLTLQATLK
jgi:hypothetical protein